jgi:hypothetical protein
MKKLIGLALISGSSWVYAQEIKFNLGPASSDGKSFESTVFFNTTLKKAYLFENLDGPKIREVDAYIKDVKKSPLQTEIFTGTMKAVLEGFHSVNEKNYIIYSVLNKEQDEHRVYMQELSSEMVMLGSPIGIATFEMGKTRAHVQGLFGNDPLDNLNLYVAKPLSGKHLVLVKERDFQLEIVCFSLDKGLLWSKTFELKNGDLDYSLVSINVAESGNLYITGDFGKERKKFPFLLAYAPSSQIQKLHIINSGEKIDDDGYNLEFTDDETPLFAGLYSSRKEGGYHLYKVNKATFELQEITSKPFAKAYWGTVQLWYSRYFGVAKIIELDNRNITIAIEASLYDDRGSRSTSPLYLGCVDPSGIEKWNTTIQNKQGQSFAGFMVGHFIHAKNNKVYVIYNDNPDNFSLAATDNQKEYLLKKKAYIATVEIDENGKAKKYTMITSDKKQSSYFIANHVYAIDKNTFQFQIQKDDKFYFATLE